MTPDDIKQEHWRLIENADDYEVSSIGRVRRIRRFRGHHPKVLAMNPTGRRRNYRRVRLRMNDGSSKDAYIHALVARAFIGLRPDGMAVNHKDADTFNNRVENLEYVTPGESVRHACRLGRSPRGESHSSSKLCNDDVLAIRRLQGSGLSTDEIGRRFSVTRGIVNFIWQRKVWKHLPEEVLT